MSKRKNLINTRTIKKLTQVELAKLLGVSERQYQNLEAGTSNGSVEIWQKLKEITGKSIDFLLEQEVIAKKPDGNPAEGK